jgi:magnesium-transporting ATPase (P-type)
MLLKGANLKNTDWALAVCVYTGADSKIMLNSQKGRQKMSHLEHKLNKLVIFIVLSQCGICFVIAIFSYFWQTTDNVWDNLFIEADTRPVFESIFNFFTYFLLLNTLLPVSLQVTLEVVKTIQAFYINNDVLMFSWERFKMCQCQAVSIVEDLG